TERMKTMYIPDSSGLRASNHVVEDVDEQHRSKEAMVLMEASLDVITKMDTLMEGLTETLRKWEKLNNADEFKVNDDGGEAAE
ncbi:9758_t:CDS:2, partial [Racocetra persica]